MDLKMQLKDTERLLVEKMDPKLYDTMRKVVRKDLKHEIAAMRAHADGCTEKCRIKNKLVELDLNRHKVIV
jgi:hypothetical protein